MNEDTMTRIWGEAVASLAFSKSPNSTADGHSLPAATEENLYPGILISHSSNRQPEHQQRLVFADD